MKFIALTMVIFCTGAYCHGQTAVPHVFRSKTAGVGYLATKQGVGVGGDFLTVNRFGNINQWGLAWDRGAITGTQTTYGTFLGSYTFVHPWFKIGDKLFLNVGGGGFLSYESARNKELDGRRNRFSPGLLAKTELEWYLGSVAVFVGGNQYYRPMSIIGDWQWRATAGVRYIVR